MKKKLFSSSNTSIFLFYYYLKFHFNFFLFCFISILKRFFLSDIYISSKLKKTSLVKENILFLLHKLLFLKKISFKKKLFLKRKFSVISFFISYIKNITFISLPNKNKHLLKIIQSINKRKKPFFYLYGEYNIDDDVGLDSIFRNWDMSVHVKRDLLLRSFSLLFNKFHKVFYYFFFLNKIHNLKYYNIINYFSFINMKWKKDFFLSLKKNFYIFKYNFFFIKRQHKKIFYKNLNRFFLKKQWFLGPHKKIKLFNYLNKVCRDIRSSFESLEYFNKHSRMKTLSFFYNSYLLRENLIHILGKKSFKDEFLFTPNYQYILQLQLKFYYDVKPSFFLNCFNFLKKKYNVKLIKDVFFFLEYESNIFLKKILLFSNNTLSNIYLNNFKWNNNLCKFFSIGDFIQIQNHFFFERYILFFNFIYFINPIIFNKKNILLASIYKRLYFFFYNNTFNNSFYINTSYKRKNIFDDNFTFFLNITNSFIFKYAHFLKTTIKKETHKKKKVLFYKSILFFLFKNNSIASNINNSSYNNRLDLSNFKHFFFSKTFLTIHSFNKTLNYYPLLLFKNYKKSMSSINSKRYMKKRIWIPRDIRKKRRYFRNRFIYKGLYDWLYYKSPISVKLKKITPKLLSRRFNKDVYSIYFFKKMSFLKTNFSNIIKKYRF